MSRIGVRDAEIAFDQIGSGERDVVLVHGFQNGRSGWAPFVERLDTDQYRVTMFDLVGCGESSPVSVPTRCSIEEYACDLVALCDALRLESPIVIGHSLGGAAAIQAALDEPETFRALVLVAPASTTGLDFVPEDALAALSHPTPEDQRALAQAAFQRPPPPAAFEEVMASVGRATAEHIEGAVQSMRVFDRHAEVAQMRLPVLLVCGDRDRHVPLRNHLATFQGIRRCGLQVYFDVGHVPFIEVPDRFADDVSRFLDACS